MLVNRNETRNWTAISAVEGSNNKWEPVMYLNASYNGKDLNVQKSIQNGELYQQNKALVDGDFSTFEADVTNEVYGNTSSNEITE